MWKVYHMQCWYKENVQYRIKFVAFLCQSRSRPLGLFIDSHILSYVIYIQTSSIWHFIVFDVKQVLYISTLHTTFFSNTYYQCKSRTIIQSNHTGNLCLFIDYRFIERVRSLWKTQVQRTVVVNESSFLEACLQQAVICLVVESGTKHQTDTS